MPLCLTIAFLLFSSLQILFLDTNFLSETFGVFEFHMSPFAEHPSRVSIGLPCSGLRWKSSN